jgi:hypothetical protein
MQHGRKQTTDRFEIHAKRANAAHHRVGQKLGSGRALTEGKQRFWVAGRWDSHLCSTRNLVAMVAIIDGERIRGIGRAGVGSGRNHRKSGLQRIIELLCFFRKKASVNTTASEAKKRHQNHEFLLCPQVLLLFGRGRLCRRHLRLEGRLALQPALVDRCCDSLGRLGLRGKRKEKEDSK